MKVDPYKHKERYLAWQESVKEGIPGISAENSELTKQYLNDMEKGLNVASVSVKGGRSFIRLNSIREKMIKFSKKFEELYNLKKVTDINEEQLISYFSDMKTGKIKTRYGTQFKSVQTPARDFKAFWHWWMKVNKKRGVEIKDIAVDLDTSCEKPDWVYLTEKEVRKLCNHAIPKYRVLIMFLFDTGIRSPTELVNVKVSDLYNDCKELNIREETSKTFGRRIKLMLCSDLLREYIEDKGLTPTDYLFPITPNRTNEYLKNLARRVLGEGETPAGAKYSELTMYDFRHNACCYWLPRYKSESALKYRFGWKKSDKIHYYSELLGMKDTISEEDLLIDVTKTEVEKKLEKTEKEKNIMEERMKDMEAQMNKIMELANKLGGLNDQK